MRNDRWAVGNGCAWDEAGPGPFRLTRAFGIALRGAEGVGMLCVILMPFWIALDLALLVGATVNRIPLLPRAVAWAFLLAAALGLAVRLAS